MKNRCPLFKVKIFNPRGLRFCKRAQGTLTLVMGLELSLSMGVCIGVGIGLGLIIGLGMQTPAFATPPQVGAPSNTSNILFQSNLFQSTDAAMCAQCHGTNGLSDPGSQIASLAGISRKEFIEKMQEFRLASPTSSVMARLAKGLTQEQINNAAIYFESQRTHPALKK